MVTPFSFNFFHSFLLFCSVFLRKSFWNDLAEPVEERPTPCAPSPCGANALCREQNGAGSCTCIEDYIGNPYEGCRPQCILNTDCPSNEACIGNKCKDPCPGTCGQNADCRVANHLPSCTCRPGFTGNPFSHCSAEPPPRKKTFIYHTG